MNSVAQNEFLKATAWLRPFTRWAAAFSFKTRHLLPAVVRNMPLKIVKLILVWQNNKAKASCGSPTR